MPAGPDAEQRQETSTVATLQSLVVAFVLAMTFRGFVTEGFVIPTGSMAPTLMGEHLQMHSEETGYSFAIDARGRGAPVDVFDPMLGPEYPLPAMSARAATARMGDRILVLKSLYPFAEPHRFDVVVFKNPTDPDGDAENYIKRLIGLPGEAVWLLDGDVFVAPAAAGGDLAAYQVQRKPDYVQRAVWQPVYHSDYVPVGGLVPPWLGPWSGQGWDASGRAYRCDTADPTVLAWDGLRRPITDETTYNMLQPGSRDNEPVSDVRVAAAVTPDRDGLAMTLRLQARGTLFEYQVGPDGAALRISGADGVQAEARFETDPLRPGRVCDVEFWQVDQSMKLFINRHLVGRLDYDWRPPQRVQQSYGEPLDTWRHHPRLSVVRPLPPQIDWSFQGSPVTLHRVQLDRDLYYRPAELRSGSGSIRIGGHNVEIPDPPGFEDWLRPGSPAFGSSPDKPAVLGPDHFMMLGDNSPASSDSRLWGPPHPYVAVQIDPTPFVVNRKLLLGKAWVVYFPAPYPLRPNGTGVVPSFGRMRFIR